MVTDYLGIRSINTVFFAVTILLLVLVIIKETISVVPAVGITIYFASISDYSFAAAFDGILPDDAVGYCVYLFSEMDVQGGTFSLSVFDEWDCDCIRGFAYISGRFIRGITDCFYDDSGKTAPAEKIRQIVAGSVVWGFGYFGMWAGNG